MDWISFFWGVGAIIFVNIVYTIWIYPKQVKEIVELTKDVRTQSKEIAELENMIEETFIPLKADHERSVTLWEERAVKLRLELDKLTASLKLIKSCPACGVEWPLYIMEEGE